MSTVKKKHSQMVRALVKDPIAIIETLTPYKMDLIEKIVQFERSASRLLRITWSYIDEDPERWCPIWVNRLHMAIGIDGEAGELLDAIKKFVIYAAPIDRENVVEEFGDLLFYFEGLSQDLESSPQDLKPTEHYLGIVVAVGIQIETLMDLLEVDRVEALIANMDKLGKRYPEWTYTDQAAQARADKNA